MFGYNKRFFFALSVLVGATIGAGIFGVPYVISRSGIIPGFFYFLILGSLSVLIHLFFGEIALRTKEKYRLVGFSQKYLGNLGKILIAASVVLGTIGALLAYLILAGNFLKILFSPLLNLSTLNFIVIFWLFCSFFVFRGVKLIAPAELLTNLLFFAVVALIFCFALPKFNFSNFTLFNPPDIFLPFGVILFSLVGWSAIPEIVEISKTPEEKKDIKKIIILSIATVIVFYLLFTFAVVGVAGQNVSPDAISGLLPFLGGKIIFLGALAGFITIADSFLILALYLRNTFIYDFKLPKMISIVASLGTPLILYLVGLRSFISVIGFVGTIIGVVEGIVIILIFKKAKTLGNREPEYSLKIPSALLYCLMLIFILGAISQFF